MPIRRTRLVLATALLTVGSVGLFVAVASGKKGASGSPPLDEHKRALHALQRLTFGPRPGDIERISAIGVDKWIDLQLHPDRIDDKQLDGRLAPFRTLHMDTREIVENFPPAQVIKAVMEGKRSMPTDPVKRAVYQAQIERLEEKKERKQDASAPNTSSAVGVADQIATDNAPPPSETVPPGKGKLDGLPE